MTLLKSVPSKALIIRFNLVFLAFFLVISAILLLLGSSSSLYHESTESLVRCSFRRCHHHKVDKVIKMKAVLEEESQPNRTKPKRRMVKREKPSFLNEMGMGKVMKIGMVNMDEEDVSEWGVHGKTIPIQFERVSELLKWKDLFPEWIDEEEESDGPMCPDIPMPEFESYGHLDVVVAKLPCKWPEEGWGRDVFRLQVHLIAAKLAAKRGKSERNGKVKVVVLSKCRPMVELFRCDDLVRREGEWWLFEPGMPWLEQKVSLPVGSCNLALPLWGKGTSTTISQNLN